MGSCTEVGKGIVPKEGRPTRARSGGDADSPKMWGSASVAGAQPTKRVSGTEKGVGNILTMLRFACSMCRGRPCVVCTGRGEGEGWRGAFKTQGERFVLVSAGEGVL